MNDEQKLIQRMECHRTKAPEGFSEIVMQKLPSQRSSTWVQFWPADGQWLAPMFSGVAAGLLIMFGFMVFKSGSAESQVGFHFELHAPGADRVELLGTFNNWKADDIVLAGPDASGHWTATVELPAGRHEYIFLVDGDRWIADPKAVTHRPDGFGRVNTVINIYEDDNV